MIRPMAKRKRSEHYVNNKEFLAALIKYREDKEIAFLAIDYQGGMQLQYVENSLKKDKDFILQVMRLSAYLEYVDDSLKKDKDVVIEAIKFDPDNIDFADDSLKEDEDIKKLLEKM